MANIGDMGILYTMKLRDVGTQNFVFTTTPLSTIIINNRTILSEPCTHTSRAAVKGHLKAS